jgi:hypothetical protein
MTKRYTVLWTKKAEQQLALIWVAAPDRAALAAAADSMDAALGGEPQDVGESRADGYRIELRGGLAIIFYVSEPDRTVSVVSAWRTREAE